MKISVKVIPNAKKPEVLKVGVDSFKVKVDAPPFRGKANKRLIELLSDYFHAPKSSILIVSGERSGKKVLRITEKEV